jgi:tetratricopeptide (TPR) repeat protein
VKYSQRLLALLFAFLLVFLFAAVAFGDFKLAVAYYNQGQFQKAINELKPDLEANPDWEFGHRLTGLCYLGLKYHSLAITSLTRAVQLKSTTFSTYLGLGQAYFSLQQFDKCTEALTQGESFAQLADRYKLYKLRGAAYYRTQKYAEAARDLSTALKDNPGEWNDHLELGVSLYNLNRIEEATQAFTRVLAAKPDQNTALEYLAKCYFKQGVAALSGKQYELALNLLTKAAGSNPKDGYIQYNLAEALLFLKKYGEAEKALNQALSLLPQSAEVYQRIGLVYEKQKKWDKALVAYQKANEIKPLPAVAEAIKRLQEAKAP